MLTPSRTTSTRNLPEKASPFPSAVTPRQIRAAVQRFTRDFSDSTKFDIIVDRRRYPPKAIVGLTAVSRLENSFNVAQRLQAGGYCALVLESAQASKSKHNFCNNDRQSAVKLARVYLSGLAKEVWQPEARTHERRDILFAHRNAVKDGTSTQPPARLPE